MDQLRRETQPPAGTPPSPVPQYWNPDTEKYERVLGAHGAPRAMLYGPNGQPISTSNRLPVDVGAQVATESTLAEAVSRLNAILTRLEGTLNVDVGGQIHADVDLGDVTVQIGEVQQGKRGQNAEPWEVTLSGSVVEIERVNNMTLEADAARIIEISQPQCRDLIITFRSTGWNTLTSGDGIYWDQIIVRSGTTYYGELRGSVIDPYQPRLWQEGSVSGGIAEVPVMSANSMFLRLRNGTGVERTFSYYVLGRV